MIIKIQDKDFNFKDAEYGECNKLIENKYVIALDFDGVITSPGEIKKLYINRLGYNLQLNEVEKNICLSKGVSLEDYKKASYKAYTERPSILPLEKDFKEVFYKLRNLKEIAIFIVSSRYDHMVSHLEEFLKYNKIKLDGIICTSEKNKIDALMEINANIFIDDSFSKLKDIIDNNKKFHKKCLLFFFRNNQNKNIRIEDNKIKEVAGWKELENIINKKMIEHQSNNNL